MHGIMLSLLKKFAYARLGAAGWDEVLAQAHMEGKTFLATSVYPDIDMLRLVKGACTKAGLTHEQFLETFGESIVPDLLSTFRGLVEPTWHLMDLLEHTESVIHTAVRMRNPEATPPKLACTRIAPDTVAIAYSSTRRMCAVGKGLIHGLARYYHEPVLVEEPECMNHGAVGCRLVVQKRG